ncbi:DUF6428 family protein [soil metagenome]
MKLSEIKTLLRNADTLQFELPDGDLVPPHFHITEVGKVTKHFIDCGGTVRTEEVVNFQLWNANDYDHRLLPEKLIGIIELAERILNLQDLEIEVEYQGITIEKFGMDHDGRNFILTTKQTDCLAKEKCDIVSHITPVAIQNPACKPNSGCC